MTVSNSQRMLLDTQLQAPHSNPMLVVAGPCSAESEEGVLSVAQLLQHSLAYRNDLQLLAFRAGVWKPRSKPGTFEGYGVKALPWLQRVQEELKLPVCVEVALPEHVEASYAHGIRQFWIGARTCGDPFAVELLAKRLAQCPDLECLYVKNPPSPDLPLWQGAIERIARANPKRIIAVLRGFYPHPGSPYRNAPRWDVAIDFQLQNPTIPLLCDASHIAGKAELVPSVAQQGLQYGLNGLFIEVHHAPQKALSDAKQQVTPEAFLHLIESLPALSNHYPLEPEGITPQIEQLRHQIDAIDEQLLELLAKRKNIVQQIGLNKRTHGLGPLSTARWKSHLRALLRYSANLGLNGRYVAELSERVHRESLRYQIVQREQEEHPPQPDA